MIIWRIFHIFSWSNLPNMPSSRAPCAALFLEKEDYDCFLEVGDRTIGLDCFHTVERLTRPSNRFPWQWSPLAPMLFGRILKCGITQLEKGRVLVTGGNSTITETFKVPVIGTDDLGQWTQITSLQQIFATNYLVNLEGVLLAFRMCYSWPGDQ